MANNIVVRDAKIALKNFSGKPGKFTPPGKREFALLIPPKIVGEDDYGNPVLMEEVLISEGWRVKHFQLRQGEECPQAFIKVEVRFDVRPPKIVLISGNSKMLLDEESVSILDWAEIQKIDLTVRPREWTNNGQSGIKAYLQTMYVTVVEDDFASDYDDIPFKMN